MAQSANQVLLELLVKATGADSLAPVVRELQAIRDAGGPAAEEAGKALDELERLGKLGAQTSGLAGLRAQLQETGDAVFLARRRVTELNAEIAAAGVPTRAMSSALDRAKTSVAGLEAQFNSQTAGITKAENALAAAGVNTKNLDAAQREIAQSLTNSANAASVFAVSLRNGGNEAAKSVGFFQSLKNFSERTGEALKSAGERALEFGKRLLEISGIAAVVTSAIAALTGERLFEKGLEQADKFEESITKAGLAVNATADELEALATAAKDAAEKTGVSGTQAAEALAQLAKGAGSAEKAIAELQPTLVLARAAQIDAAKAADILSTALQEFGLQATDSQRVIDLFAKTASVSKVDLADLSDSFGKIAPDAKAAGVSIEETAALFGALADNGVRGKKATGDLQQVFQQLADKSSPLSARLFDLGLNGKSLSEVIEALAKDSTKANSVFAALGTTGSSALRALVSASPDLQRVAGLIRNNAGAAQTLADTLDKELGGAFQQFKAAFNDAAREFSEPLLKPLAEQFQLARQSIINFTKSADFKNVAQSVANFVTGAVASLREFFANVDFSKVAKSISDFTGSANDSLATFKGGLSGVGTVASTVTNTVALVFHTLQGIIGAVVTSSADFIARAADVVVIAKKLTGASAEALAAAKAQADNLHTTAEELKKRTTEAFEAAGKNIENLAAAINKSGEESSKAAPKIKEAGEAAAGSAQGHKNAADAAQKHGDEITRLVPKIERFSQAQGKAVELSDETTGALGKLSINVNSLKGNLDKAADGAVTAFESIVKAQQRGELSVDDVRRAYARMAEQIRTAAEFGDAEAKQRAEDLIAEKGLVVDLGQSYDHLAAEQRHASEAANAAAGNAALAASIAADKAAQAAEKAKDWGDATERASAALNSAASEGGESLAKLDEALANTRASFLSVSDAAAKAFDSRLVDNFGLAFDSTGIGFARVIQAMNEAAAQTTAELIDERGQIDSLSRSYDQMGVAGVNSFDATSAAGQKQLELMQQTSAEIQNGTFQFGILGKSDLGPLQQALDGAIARTQALVDQAKAAKAAFDSVSASLQDELDQAQGNQQAVEQRRFEKQLADLKAAAKAAGQANSAQFKQDVENATKLHELKLKQIADEQKKADGGGSGGSNPPPTPSPSRNSSGGGAAFFSNQQLPPVIVQFHNGTFIGGSKEQVVRDLMPDIQKVGTEIQRRTIGPFFGKQP